VATVTRSRCPDSNRCTIAGSRTATGRASAIEAGRPVRRTGATRPSGSVGPLCGSRSYSLTNSTASPVGLAARTRTDGAPTTSIAAGSGADTKSACWPGTSRATPSTRATPAAAAPPGAASPGSEDSAAGVPLGGLAAGWGGPATATAAVAWPPVPG